MQMCNYKHIVHSGNDVEIVMDMNNKCCFAKSKLESQLIKLVKSHRQMNDHKNN